MSMSKNWKIISESERKTTTEKSGKRAIYIVTIGVTSYTSVIVENELVIAAGEWMAEHGKRFNTEFVRFRKTQKGEATVIVISGTWRVKCNRCRIMTEAAARRVDCVRHGCEGVMSA